MPGRVCSAPRAPCAARSGPATPPERSLHDLTSVQGTCPARGWHPACSVLAGLPTEGGARHAGRRRRRPAVRSRGADRRGVAGERDPRPPHQRPVSGIAPSRPCETCRLRTPSSRASAARSAASSAARPGPREDSPWRRSRSPAWAPSIAAGAIALGLLGAVAGGALGGQLDDVLSKGLPTDELYVYRHALRNGAHRRDRDGGRRRRGGARPGSSSRAAGRRASTPPGRTGGSVSATPRKPSTRVKAATSGRTRRSTAWGSTRRSASPRRCRPSTRPARTSASDTGPLVEALAFRAGYERGRARWAGPRRRATGRPPTDGPTLIAALLACLVAGAG